MERFDITIQMYSADASGTQYVWEKVPAEEGDFVLYADAQATIAALQDTIMQMGGQAAVLAKDAMAAKEQVAALQERVRTATQLIIAEIGASGPEDLEEAIGRIVARLTQHTSELEAAKAELNTVRRDAGLDCGDHSCLYAMNKTGMRTNGGCRCSPKHMKNDLERSRKAYDDLHAELERVRGELAQLQAGIDLGAL